MPTKKRTVKHAPIVTAFAERLKEVRLARGMTQRQLADTAHITFSYISRLEAGGAAPGIDLVEKLAAALNASITDLFPPHVSEKVSDQRDQVKKLFEVVVSQAGPETLGMMDVFLSRLAEASALRK